ncbi:MULTISPECIES: DUF5327 family protein [Kurthia]|uniref:DUF5327 family protein n=1 Tax=Kurthia TaxID=1649 RepID=UPI001143DEFD|nr:DUF5327 family protein [Kurthia gibsonii]GED20594.1 hypothetical protein KGI01_23350 [Kurthia gibsonii]
MISYDAIIKELQKQIAQAQQAASTSEKREAFSAMRALCDVALQTNEPSVQPTSFTAPSQPTPPVPTQANKLHEPDANGDSLFDF